jgi:hypothetical protein
MVEERDAAGNFPAALAIQEEFEGNVSFGGSPADGGLARAGRVGGHNGKELVKDWRLLLDNEK